jgi:hypothetical protein
MNPFAEPLYATLLVLVVTNTRVILAADSRKNTLHVDGIREQGTMDKIFQTGDCYYAVSGLSSTEDGSFSLQAIIHKALTSSPHLREAIRHLAKAVAAELKAYLAALKQCSPTLFAQLQRDSHWGGEIVLVQRINDVPAAALLTYKVTTGEPVKVVVDSWRIDSNDIKEEEDCFWRAIGHTDFFGGMPSAKEVAQNPVATIKSLMEAAAKAHPQFVSGPLNIVELARDGTRWIEKSATAPAQL